ncbi:MAG: hypothetical protein ACYCYR_01380 [Desulfobulbaceae bacterium]|jgi:hypothetical protein
MQLIADAHVHVYPFHSPQLVLDVLRRNLVAMDRDAICLAFLAERADCRFFADLAQRGSRLLDRPVVADRLGECLVLREHNFPDLYLFAGRQIVTRERIEILALTTDVAPADGLPAAETVTRILEGGGIPVLSWAPGKWFLARKKVVAGLLERFSPGSLLVGDSSLRPRCWLMPVLMKQAIARGFGLVVGSDPLPVPGEEAMIGTYGFSVDAEFAPEDPVRSIRTILGHPGFRPRLRGTRGGPLKTMRRLFANYRAGRRHKDTANS